MLAWGGRIDGLVNNAGGQFPAPLKDISLNGWNAVIANNMTATFLVSKEVYLRWMERQRRRDRECRRRLRARHARHGP